MSGKTDRTDIDVDALPAAPGTQPGGDLPGKPTPDKPVRHKATDYNGTMITKPLENDSGNFYPQDDTPAILEKKEGPKQP